MNLEKVIFAAGCFWGVQNYFDQIPGIEKSMVGYTGGHVANPNYDDVCSNATGHAEAVSLEFDPNKLNYETLVKQFFRMHDPTQFNRQGPDVGDQYRSAIFYGNDEQKAVAERVRDEAQAKFKEPIATQIIPASIFYPAEEYHQKYTEKTGRGICHIPYASLN